MQALQSYRLTAVSKPIPPWFPRGVALLREPTLNKGSAFTDDERDALGLRGLLPPHVSTQEEQVSRVLENFGRLHTPLAKYIMLESLRDRNEALFYRVITDYPDEMTPIVYTPTVGLACQQFGHIYRRPRGIFVSVGDRGRIAEVLRHWPQRDVSVIVLTDGERVLGLGDLGVNGMGVPIGKLSLYTAYGGVDPARCLPVMLDVGTNNESLRGDPLYLGLREPRLAGAAYDDLVDEFVDATQEVFPGALVQFEDFAPHNALRLLDKYRERIPTFNDDIQGTAAVTVAGLMAALRVTGKPIAEQRFLCTGSGKSATAILDLLAQALEARGLTSADARACCWLADADGLVVARRNSLAADKVPYAHDHAPITDLLTATRTLQPTALIGVAAAPQAFTRDVVATMAAVNDRPILLALSHPHARSECTAEQAYQWSDGRALFASGSPFDPVAIDGKRLVPRQGNNSYVFPGVGLGVIASRAIRVTNSMFLAAARTLADAVSPGDLEHGSLYPPLHEVRELSAQIAVAVADVAYTEGIAARDRPDDLASDVKQQIYDPHYRSYV